MDGVHNNLKNDVIKASLLLVSLIIGLSCGSTKDSFYIAVLIQSLSNAYDSAAYIGSKSKLLTGIYVIILFVTVLSFICSVLHFVPNITAFTEQTGVIITVCAFLSLPLVVVLINIFITIKTGNY